MGLNLIIEMDPAKVGTLPHFEVFFATRNFLPAFLLGVGTLPQKVLFTLPAGFQVVSCLAVGLNPCSLLLSCQGLKPLFPLLEHNRGVPPPFLWVVPLLRL